MNKLILITDIVGYIGLLLLYIQVVFGSRHIFKFFTKDTVLVNKVHSFVGKWAIIAVFIHPLIAMMARLEDFLWIVTPNFNVESETHITFGRFALVLFLVVWFTSAIIRAKIKWHPWKYIHLLSYPIVILSFIHIKDLGTLFETYTSVQFIWAFALFTVYASIIIRLTKWAGFGKQVYILKDKKLVGNDIVIVDLEPVGKKVNSTIGQHFYLQAARLKSEHPFTVIRNTDGNLVFGIRKVAKFWNEINSKNIGDKIFVDGPYGVFTLEGQNTKPKVIISAGIGVTPFIDLVEKFGENTIYINCNRALEEAVGRDILKSKSSKYIDILDTHKGETDTGIVVGRISPEIIKNTVGENISGLPFFVCGSPNFIKAIKKMLIDAGVKKENVYFEELGF